MGRRALTIRTDVYDKLKLHCYAERDESIGEFVDQAIETALADPTIAARIVETIRVERAN